MQFLKRHSKTIFQGFYKKISRSRKALFKSKKQQTDFYMWEELTSFFTRTLIGFENKALIPLVLFCLCISSYAGSYGDFSYYVNRTNIIITQYSGTGGSVTIPSAIPSVGPVTEIGDCAFCFCTSLTSIIIPNSVTKIRIEAFLHCTSLTNVIMGNSITSIEGRAFEMCANLKNITIPNGVTNIAISAFKDCNSLTNITVNPTNSVYSSLNGVLLNKSQNVLIQCPGGMLGSCTIPNCVNSIGDYAFQDCTSLTNISTSDSVTNIGCNAFRGCTNLTKVTIPNSVTIIGDNVFHGCTNLANAIIGNSVTSISDYTFYGCISLTNISMSDSVTSIENYVFQDCTSLTSITIPNCVTSIGYCAFQDCTSLTNISISDSVTRIGYAAFIWCTNLTSVTIPSSVTSIGCETFRACTSLTSAYFYGNAPSTLGYFAFADTATNFTIYYPSTATGWSTPTWYGYPAYPIIPNAVPQFAALDATNFFVNPGTTVLVTNTATDSDLPTQTLTYTLITSPIGSSLNSNVFIWYPTMSQAGTTNLITIVVTDNGTPSLSATQTFTVTVNKTITPKVASFKLVSGVPTLTIDEAMGSSYVIETSTNLVDWQVTRTNTSSLTTWSDTNSQAPFKFYRFRVP